MPASEACFDGIKAHGLRWRHELRLGVWPGALGRLNDLANDGQPVDDAEVERVTLKIVAAVRAAVDRYEWAKKTDLDHRADELECVADCGLGEVNYAMGELYDSCDYWRILIVAPRLPASGTETRQGRDGHAE